MARASSRDDSRFRPTMECPSLVDRDRFQPQQPSCDVQLDRAGLQLQPIIQKLLIVIRRWEGPRRVRIDTVAQSRSSLTSAAKAGTTRSHRSLSDAVLGTRLREARLACEFSLKAGRGDHPRRNPRHGVEFLRAGGACHPRRPPLPVVRPVPRARRGTHRAQPGGTSRLREVARRLEDLPHSARSEAHHQRQRT